MNEPSRAWAFLLLGIAVFGLALPVAYTLYTFTGFSLAGRWLASAAVVVALFAILTVFVSVLRFFRHHQAERRNL